MLVLIDRLHILESDLNKVRISLKSLVENKTLNANELEALTKKAVLAYRQSGGIGAEAFDQGYSLNIKLFFNDSLELLEKVAIEKTELYEKIQYQKSLLNDDEILKADILGELKKAKDNKRGNVKIPARLFIEYLTDFNVKIHARTKGQLLKTQYIQYNAVKHSLGADWIYIGDSGKQLSNGVLQAFKTLYEAL